MTMIRKRMLAVCMIILLGLASVVTMALIMSSIAVAVSGTQLENKTIVLPAEHRFSDTEW